MKLLERKKDKIVMSIKKNDIVLLKNTVGQILCLPSSIEESEFKNVFKFDREEVNELFDNILKIRDDANIVE